MERKFELIRKSDKTISLFIIIVLLAFCSCLSESLVWTGSYFFPKNTWNFYDRVVFTPDSISLSKTASAQNKKLTGTLLLRYNADASVESFPLVVEMENPEMGEISCDTIQIDLLPMEKRTASQSELGVFEATKQMALKSNLHPGWNITLYPLTAEMAIKGIYSLTFEIESIHEEKQN